jgi:hypothetical protein
VEGLADALGVSVLLLDAVIVLLFGQAALQIYCLWDLARRSPGDGRSPRFWALVIIFGGIVGSIVYLIKKSGDERDDRTVGLRIHRSTRNDHP